MKTKVSSTFTVFVLAVSLGGAVSAQTRTGSAPQSPAAVPGGAAAGATAKNAPPAAAATLPPGYVIGADDVLTIFFWREKDLSGDVVVRPDGRISIPLVNEVMAAGLTPEELRQQLTTASEQFIQDPTVSVVVKQINSRKVYITGEIVKPGSYPLSEHMTVLQLIALAGGLHDFADKSNIVLMRSEKRPDGVPWSYKINYSDLLKRQKLLQNLELKPGDTVIVP